MNISKLLENFKWPNLSAIGVPWNREQRETEKNDWEKLSGQNFSEIDRNYKFLDPKSQSNPKHKKYWAN